MSQNADPDLWHEGDPPPDWLGAFQAWVMYRKGVREQYLKVGFGLRSVMIRDAEAMVRQLREQHLDVVAYFTM